MISIEEEFKEEFPSFCLELNEKDGIIQTFRSLYDIDEDGDDAEVHFIKLYWVEEHCLDKQRVREAARDWCSCCIEERCQVCLMCEELDL